jgi:hypothetical protein
MSTRPISADPSTPTIARPHSASLNPEIVLGHKLHFFLLEREINFFKYCINFEVTYEIEKKVLLSSLVTSSLIGKEKREITSVQLKAFIECPQKEKVMI